MAIYRSVSNVNREIKGITRSVGGVNKTIKEVYRSVGNVNRKVFSSELVLYDSGNEYTNITGGWQCTYGSTDNSSYSVKDSETMMIQYIKTTYIGYRTLNNISSKGYTKLNVLFSSILGEVIISAGTISRSYTYNYSKTDLVLTIDLISDFNGIVKIANRYGPTYIKKVWLE